MRGIKKMADKLDVESLKKGFINIKIGMLTKEIADIIKLDRDECDIVLWEDRFKYIEKHKENFESEESFIKHIELIPDIIENPDYVGRHPKDNSIQYIKQLDKLMIVAVRIKYKGKLCFRTAYPLTEKQLKDYIESNTAWKVK